jgi:photosystem II stability/assembly factor-like uncharacterized protein
VADFAFDARRQAVYAMVNGALLRSTDRGATWQEVRRLEPVAVRGRLAVDPRDGSTLYGGDTNLYRLDNGGDTLTRLRQSTAGVGGFRVDSVTVSPHDGSVWIGTGSGIEVSFDRGATWSRRDEGLRHFNVGPFALVESAHAWAMDPGRPGRIVIGTDTGVFGTEDGGQSWQELTATLRVFPEVPERPRVDAVALDPGDSRRIYAGTFNRGIIVSDDGGQTWCRPAPPYLAVASIAVDPRPPHDVYAAVADYVGNRYGVIASRDHGNTWGWNLVTRDRPTALAADQQHLYASAPTGVASYAVRLDPRQGSYAPSFASYLAEGTLRDLATTTRGETVLAFNSSRSQPDVAILRIAR